MTEQLSGVDRLSQDEAHYTTAAKSTDLSCATCRWFDAATDYCGIVKSTPVDIAADGGCDRHEAKAGALPEPVEVAEVIKGEPETPEKPVELPVTVAVSDSNGIVNKIVKTVKQAFTPKPDDSAFQVFKAADGKHYWIARYTNNFEDRDKEILSQKAHESYVARVNLGLVEAPELWIYHAKGTKHGQADEIWMHAGFIFAFGHFDDTEEAKSAIKYYQREKDIELSHGFTYPKWGKTADGVYESYNTFEISTLPKGAASNPFTSFEEIETMALSAKQEATIEKVIGKDGLKRIQALHSNAEDMKQVLDAAEVKRKDFVETQPTESIEAGSGEAIKTLLADMIAVQAALVEEIDGFKAELATSKTAQETAVKSVTENKTTITQLTADLAAVKAQLSARPKTASTDPATLIEKKDLPAEVVNANVEIDNFWHAPVKGV